MTASAWVAPISRIAAPPGAIRRGSCGRDRAIGVETVRPREQGAGRFVIANLRRQGLAGADIGRVGEDQVEPLGRARVAQSPGRERRARRQAEPVRIGARHFQSRSGRSIPRPVASGHWSSAASSKVPGPVPRSRIVAGGRVGEMVDRCLDQRLAVGARHERAGADLQIDRPEGAGAGDIGDRLVSPGGERRVARRSRGSGSSRWPRSRASRVMPSACAISSSASRRGVSETVAKVAVASASALLTPLPLAGGVGGGRDRERSDRTGRAHPRGQQPCPPTALP